MNIGWRRLAGPAIDHAWGFSVVNDADSRGTTAPGRRAGAVSARPGGQAIEVAGLTKSYGSTVAVEDLSFTVAYERITGFLGPNGSGKTTTLRALLGLIRPTAGIVTIDGLRYGELPDPVRSVGALLDDAAVHPGRSGRDHLRMLALAAGIPPSRVETLLGLVGLQSAAGRRAGEYSFGMRRRLGLATALLGDPRVLVLDEPANGLDAQGIRWLRDLLRSLAAEGRAVLISSHILAEVAQTVDDVVVISCGQTITQAPLGELLAARPGSTLEDIYLELTGTAEGEPS